MSNLSCDDFDDYLAGELPVERRIVFATHLETCSECRNAVREWQKLRRLLLSATEQLEQPEFVCSEPIESDEPPRFARESNRVQRIRVAALLGVSLLAAVLFGIVLRPVERREATVNLAHPQGPIVTTLLPPKNVEFSGDVIGVPIDIGDPDVTVVWLYPTGQEKNVTN